MRNYKDYLLTLYYLWLLERYLDPRNRKHVEDAIKFRAEWYQQQIQALTKTVQNDDDI